MSQTIFFGVKAPPTVVYIFFALSFNSSFPVLNHDCKYRYVAIKYDENHVLIQVLRQSLPRLDERLRRGSWGCLGCQWRGLYITHSQRLKFDRNGWFVLWHIVFVCILPVILILAPFCCPLFVHKVFFTWKTSKELWVPLSFHFMHCTPTFLNSGNQRHTDNHAFEQTHLSS